MRLQTFLHSFGSSRSVASPLRPLLCCSAVGMSAFQKSNEDSTSEQVKVFSNLLSIRYVGHFYCYHLLLMASRVLHSLQALNQYVHFSRDLLQTPDEVHGRRRLEFSSPVPPGDICHRSPFICIGHAVFSLTLPSWKRDCRLL